MEQIYIYNVLCSQRNISCRIFIQNVFNLLSVLQYQVFCITFSWVLILKGNSNNSTSNGTYIIVNMWRLNSVHNNRSTFWQLFFVHTLHLINIDMYMLQTIFEKWKFQTLTKYYLFILMLSYLLQRI